MKTSLSKGETWSLLSLSVACLAILGQTLNGDGAPLVASIALSGIAFAMTYSMVTWLGPSLMKAGLKGKDMSKTRKIEIPEAMGAVSAVVYLLVIIVFIPFPFYKDIVAGTSGGGYRDVVLEVQRVETGRFLHLFPHSKLASYLSAILSLQSIILLGVGDDLFDIRWRHKVLIPAFASIPILIVYLVDFGVTKIVVPTPIRPYIGELVDLGWLYYVYMAAISIFCPNSINIVAGINGIEVGQSIVIAVLILINDALYLWPFNLTASATNTARHPATDSHLFSTYFLLPFLGVSLALLAHNWYPARVFVGDTYCYFAGMVFAVVAIQGHFSKTLLLLLIPQIFNFVYSAPQLFGLVPCPRHRLPHFNARTGLLEPSWSDFTTSTAMLAKIATDTNAHGGDGNGQANGKSIPSMPMPPTPRSGPKTRLGAFSMPVQLGLKLLAALRLLRVEQDPESGQVLRCTNLTILNLWLVWFGPLREDVLAMSVLGMQMALGLAGLWARHRMALWIFTTDNL